jgi:hypothetical protein|uniref:hypothetical protein n=1 Tax=Cyanobium sp. TaxID=2164130 RepID=UPI004049F559
MVFNRKEVFRHDFGSEGAEPAAIAIRPAAEKSSAIKASAPKTAAVLPGDSFQFQAPKAGGASPEAKQAGSTEAPVSALTTAEAIAAELRAAQEAMPAPSNATFAPDCLNPVNAVPTARRRAGANLAGFKTMGKDMLKS